MSEHWSPRELAHVAVLTAASMALGFALAWVPNVELMTLTIFLAGWLLGMLKGALVGGLAAVLFSVFNPWGPALPPVILGQAVGHALVGLTGGVLRVGTSGRGRWLRSTILSRRDPRGAVLMGMTGALLTLGYDAITNAAHAVAMGFIKHLWAVVAAGISFGLLHVISNTAIFALLGPTSLRLVESRRGRW